ncbi:MAG: CoA ester lyase [Rhodococcus sp. (in: high G+C Gram-positive bacteria)]
MTVPRSFLYVPAVKPALFDKAVAGAADAIIVDLEDAVPLPHKATARAAVAHWLDTREPSGADVWVRVTPEFLQDDLAAAARPGVAGILVAKCSPASLAEADDRLGDSDIALAGLIETASALRGITDMAADKRLLTFGIGEVDLLADLRITRTDSTRHVVDAIRTDIVIACAAAGLEAPIAPTSTDFRDLNSFAATTEHFVNIGFRSRTAVHPSQVPVINAALTPAPDDVRRAARLVELFDSAAGGPTVDDDGRFVDEAVVRGAREILARA